MLTEPYACHWPARPSRCAFRIGIIASGRSGLCPDVRVMVGQPSAIDAIVNFGRLCAIDSQAADEIGQWQEAFRKIGYFRRPVIHLSINVGRIIRSPRRLNVPVPDALQIGGQPARAGRGNQQVTTVLIVEFRQSVVSGVLFEAF